MGREGGRDHSLGTPLYGGCLDVERSDRKASCTILATACSSNKNTPLLAPSCCHCCGCSLYHDACGRAPCSSCAGGAPSENGGYSLLLSVFDSDTLRMPGAADVTSPATSWLGRVRRGWSSVPPRSGMTAAPTAVQRTLLVAPHGTRSNVVCVRVLLELVCYGGRNVWCWYK